MPLRHQDTKRKLATESCGLRVASYGLRVKEKENQLRIGTNFLDTDTSFRGHKLTLIDTDLFLASFGVPSKAGSATLAKVLFDASIYRNFVRSRLVPSKPDPIYEAG